ncbi:LacI family transcriptional regulator [Breoghania corrubedonensis]|uniref:LacI family transcriptional regulator n=1 Tax=Breoghania corrubedonensis TaxID=665038 RepID=A0A2T5VGF8_9HYPH|nr:LacI family DNA-binding transcriptional regulator [Breoghania corrubedonensis]PTW62818.1 LacI family transcriptional regulator [Breoghania corrubedonensis]
MDDHRTRPKVRPAIAEGASRRKRLTLSHLAEQLGVSTATISLALRNSPLVAQATRERVKREAEAAGYIYNRSAAALRTARSNVVGVAVHDILNPYFAEIFGALEDTLGENDQIVFICNHRDDVERQRTFVQALLQHRADGLVLCPSVGTDPAEINRLVDAGLPVTLICRDVEGARAPVVRGDDIAGTLEAVRYLIAAGHRDIAFLGGRRGSSTGRDRHEGWVRALREVGIDPGAQLYEPEMMTRAQGFEAVGLVLDRKPRPTAVMCFNDMVARGLIEALRRHGSEAGRDIAVIGYDDTLDAATATPSLSTVNNGAGEIGARAAEMILAQVAGEPIEADRVVITPRLVERESTGTCED